MKKSLKWIIIFVIIVTIIVAIIGSIYFIISKKLSDQNNSISNDFSNSFNSLKSNETNNIINSNQNSVSNVVSSTNERKKEEKLIDKFDITNKKPNLPDNIILQINGKSAILNGESMSEIFKKLNISEKDEKLKKTEYSGGALFWKYGNFVGGISFDEKFKSVSSKELMLKSISFDNALKEYDISILGISKTANIEDVIKVFGSIDKDLSNPYYLTWENVKIGKFIIKVIASFDKKGDLNTLRIDFQ